VVELDAARLGPAPAIAAVASRGHDRRLRRLGFAVPGTLTIGRTTCGGGTVDGLERPTRWNPPPASLLWPSPMNWWRPTFAQAAEGPEGHRETEKSQPGSARWQSEKTPNEGWTVDRSRLAGRGFDIRFSAAPSSHSECQNPEQH